MVIRPRTTDLRVYSIKIRWDSWKPRVGKELHKGVTTSKNCDEQGGVAAVRERERELVRGLKWGPGSGAGGVRSFGKAPSEIF